MHVYRKLFWISVGYFWVILVVIIANDVKDRVQATLGYGAFGTVVNAKDIATGDVVAVKLLHRGDAFQGDIYREQHVYEELLQRGDSRIEQVISLT